MSSAIGRRSGGAIGALTVVLVASTAGSQDLGLPAAQDLAAGLLAPTWCPVPNGKQVRTQFGDAVLLLPDQAVIGGGPAASTASSSVSVWRAPLASDPLAPFGWRKVQDLLPLDPLPGWGPAGDFGQAVAGDSNWIFVGAPTTSYGVYQHKGAVHVFRRDPSGPWIPVAILTDPLAEPGDFGAALAFDGTTLVVGVPGRFADGTDDPVGGFVRYPVTADAIGAGISFASPLGGNWHSHLGRSVAVDGNTIVLADPSAAIPGVPGGGAVVVTVVDGDGGPVVVEAVLGPPDGQTATEFGSSIALHGDRLAIGAAQEDANGLADAGVVRVYQRNKGIWLASTTLVGESQGSHLGRVALHGSLLATGATGTPGNAGLVGEASLYELGEAGPMLLARASATATAGFTHDDVGRAVAVANGRWCFAETVGFGAAQALATRIYDVAGALADCDGNGVSDLAEVLAGAADCDGNGVPDTCPNQTDCNANGQPDACDVLWEPAFDGGLPDDGMWWGWTIFNPANPNLFAGLWIIPAQVPAGTDGWLRGVQGDWIVPGGEQGIAQPTIVAIYEDPDQDGDPHDASLLGAYVASPSIAPGPDRIIFDPQHIGRPGTRYFIGVGVVRCPNATASLYLRSVPLSAGPPKVWEAAGADAYYSQLDLTHPANNTWFELNTQVSSFVCEGLFASPVDANLDGVPDACECPGDLDGNGAVGGSDLAILLAAWSADGPADLDGDGVVGPVDLALLLGNWGGC